VQPPPRIQAHPLSLENITTLKEKSLHHEILQKQHRFYCGVDLHANATYVCILDATGEIVAHKNIPPPLERLPTADQTLSVTAWWSAASTCSPGTGWLADLCADENIDFVLGHALYMRAVHGGKAKNDKIDSHKIAALLRGGTYPLAYFYSKEIRTTRDLKRRRYHLTRKRSELFSHIQNTATQYNLPEQLERFAKPSERGDLLKKFPDSVMRKMVETDLLTIEHHEEHMGTLERQPEKIAERNDPVNLALLMRIHGVGRILGIVIFLRDRKSNPKPGTGWPCVDQSLVKKNEGGPSFPYTVDFTS
jgi:hypothetical protein